MSYSHSTTERNGDSLVEIAWYRCDLTGQIINEAWPHIAMNGLHISRAALQEVLVPEYFKMCPVPFRMIVADIEQRIGSKTAPRRKPIPVHLRRIVLESNGGRCVTCGSTEDLQCDHIRPVSRGGSNHRNNLQPMCRTCNARKGARFNG